jgi:hypothetical protein
MGDGGGGRRKLYSVKFKARSSFIAMRGVFIDELTINA